MQAIHGNPHYRPQTEQTDRTQQPAASSQAKPGKGGMATRGVVDQLDLSATAKQLVETGGPGKSGNSPAHQARAAIAADPELAGLPFGQVVKAYNHGTLDSLVTPAPAETGEAGAVDPLATDPLATEDPADPAGAVLPETDAPVEESADGLPSQTIPGTDMDTSLLDLIDGAEDEAETEQPG